MNRKTQVKTRHGEIITMQMGHYYIESGYAKGSYTLRYDCQYHDQACYAYNGLTTFNGFKKRIKLVDESGNSKIIARYISEVF